ncbi:phosphoprotein phosphatase PP4 catalytic subunit [Glugoides intestinalis]
MGNWNIIGDPLQDFMEELQLEKLLENLQNLILPTEEDLLRLIQKSQLVLAEEENIQHINGDAAIVGDLHGQFFDFLNMINLIGTDINIVFLGDYVDRGLNSVELFIYLLALKLINKKRITLLRGNHENRSQTAVYGFEEECISKYNHVIYWKFCEIFEVLPLVAIVNKKYFCVHGGISPELTLEWLELQDRTQEYSDFSCILWGDPVDSVKQFATSQRGAGFLYGKVAIDLFLKKVNCQFLVRSHQLVLRGFEEKFDGKCITIWSAPNYCYKCKNIACFMSIKPEGHDFVLFDAVAEQYRI